MKTLIEIIKERLHYPEGEWDGGTSYIGFNFNAQSDRISNIRNYEVVKLFRDYLEPIGKYIIPISHKGSLELIILNKKELDTFVFEPKMMLNRTDWNANYGGWGSNDIIKRIIEIHNQLRLNKLIEEEQKENIEIKNISRIITKEDRYKVLTRQKWRCNICNIKLKYSLNSDWGGEVAHIDHIHPFSKRNNYSNGIININETSNLQALCPKCNLGKKDKNIN